jgi:hypothetical protein
MASNFKIFTHRKRNALYLKLIGDFDGSSACELVNLLKENCQGGYKVIIHTSRLNTIFPFGCDVFQRNLSSMNRFSNSIMFTGEYAIRFAFEKGLSV